MTYNPNNPYPPQAGQYPPQQQQHPQQQYQQPPQQGYQQPPPQQYQQPPQQGYQQPPQQPPQQQQYQGGMPQYAAPDDAAMRAHYEQQEAKRAEEAAKRGQAATFLKLPGPDGNASWANAPIGYRAEALVYLLPPWAQGKPIEVLRQHHFLKTYSKPKGYSVQCPGEGCGICRACEQAMSHPDPQIQKRGKDFGRPKTKYLFQLAVLDNLQMHYGQDGVPRPVIMDAPKQLWDAVRAILLEYGVKTCTPDQGRPIKIIKRKTGKENWDIEWSAMPKDSMPLPQEFYPLLQNMHDLEKFVKAPSAEDMQAAVTDLGFGNNAYTPGPQPPYGNPYGQQPYGQPPPQQPPMQGYPQQGYQPPPQQQGAPPQQPMHPPPPMGPPPQQAAPPLNPPPVTTTGQAPAQYAPQVGTAPPPPPPAAPQQAQQPVRQPVPQEGGNGAPQGGNMALSLPLAAGTTLPDGRERCFGGFNAEDNFCKECPEWIRNQCVPQTAGAAAPPPAGDELANLQNQLSGE